MLGGDHLLVDGGVPAAAEAFDLGDAAWRHDDAAPAAAGEFEDGPDQAERAGLAGEAPDHLGAATDFDEGPLEQIRTAYALAVLGRPAQVRDERVVVVGDHGHRGRVGRAVVGDDRLEAAA